MSQVGRGDHAALIMRNSGFTAVARGVQIVTSYGVTVTVTRYLTVEAYGEYSFIVALVAAVMSLTYVGVQQVMIREIASDRAKGGSSVGAASFLRTALSAVAIVFILAITPFLGLSPVAKSAVLVAVVAEFFLAFGMLTRSVFQAYERMVYEPLLALLGSLVLAAGIGAVVVLDLGFIGLFGAAALANAVPFAVGAYLLERNIVRVDFRFSLPQALTFLKHATVIGLSVFLSMNLFRVNVFMLKGLRTAEEVAFFQLPNNLVSQMQVLPFALVTAIFPVFARLIREDPEQMAAIYEKVFKYMLVFSTFAALSISLFSREIIELFFGGKYAPSARVLAVVAWTFVPLSLEMLLGSMLVVMNKQKYSVYFGGVAIGYSLLGGLVLLPHHGALGAAFLTVSSCCILFACSFFVVSRNTVAVSLPALVGGVLPAVAAGAAATILLKPLSMVAAALGGGAAFFGALRLFRVVLPAELQIVRAAVKNILRRDNRERAR